jgi:hypothetical protein
VIRIEEEHRKEKGRTRMERVCAQKRFLFLDAAMLNHVSMVSLPQENLKGATSHLQYVRVGKDPNGQRTLEVARHYNRDTTTSNWLPRPELFCSNSPHPDTPSPYSHPYQKSRLHRNQCMQHSHRGAPRGQGCHPDKTAATSIAWTRSTAMAAWAAPGALGPSRYAARQ